MKRGPVIGVLSTWFGGTYFGGLLGGIKTEVAGRGGRIVAVQTLDAGTFSTDFEEAPPFPHRVAWEHIDGFVVFLNGAGPHYLRQAQESGRPVVVISDDPSGLTCPTIGPDNHTGVVAAVDHLVGHGHTRIAFAGHLPQVDAAERFAAYRGALLAHGITPDETLLYPTGDMQEAGGERAARDMLAAGLPSTAVVTGNDQNAIGLSRLLHAAGLDLPADQAVVGFDDLPGGASRVPSLTTVRQPLAEVGELAVRLVARMLAGEDLGGERFRLPTTLVVRESCGCLGPLALTSGRAEPGGEGLRAGIAALLGTDLEPFTKDLMALMGERRAIPGPQLRRRLAPLTARLEDYEVTVAVMRLIREYGRTLGDVEDLLYQIFVVLAQEQSAFQAEHGRSTMAALGTQYTVSMQLLRSQERDPRSLDWLRATDVRTGCLGLWPDTTERLEIIASFDCDRGSVLGEGRQVPIESFPPAEMIERADIAADEMVYLSHLKVGRGDWGMLALVGPVHATLAEGRETMNQWAALLSVALEHEAVLQTLREQEEVLRRAAHHDDLTGLPNRGHFRDRLTAAMARARRYPGARYAVLLLDLDGFKLVNDSLGHEAGDRLLQEVARRMTGELRADEMAARLGGDEFAVLIENFDGPDEPTALAERLQNAVSAPLRVAGTEVAVSASIGIATSTEDYTDTDAVMRDADVAMYYAKSRGKRAHALFASSMTTSALDRLRTEAELRQAVDSDELVLYWQPIVALDGDATVRFEALLRWRHPAKGILLPADFLPLAEESDLGVRIGKWVLRNACAQLASWGDASIAVNVSDRHFRHGHLLEDVVECLAAYDLDPARLAVEITEAVLMRDVRRTRETLGGLHEIGVEVHVDDFGTGSSSLSVLHALPLGAVKIDRTFVSRAAQGDPGLVRAIVAMGRALGLSVIAEGVETDEELAAVRELGCTHAQGFVIAAPAPADLTARPFRRVET